MRSRRKKALEKYVIYKPVLNYPRKKKKRYKIYSQKIKSPSEVYAEKMIEAMKGFFDVFEKK